MGDIHENELTTRMLNEENAEYVQGLPANDVKVRDLSL
jgi:hypothetical protein